MVVQSWWEHWGCTYHKLLITHFEIPRRNVYNLITIKLKYKNQTLSHYHIWMLLYVWMYKQGCSIDPLIFVMIEYYATILYLVVIQHSLKLYARNMKYSTKESHTGLIVLLNVQCFIFMFYSFIFLHFSLFIISLHVL